MKIEHAVDLTPRDIGACLGKICRYAGRGKFWPVLLHVFVVSDFLPDNLKFFGLTHDNAECLTGDICTPYKTQEVKIIEAEIDAAMSLYQGVWLPTETERAEVKYADSRARQGEIQAGVGDSHLRTRHPVPDTEAVRTVLHYVRQYPPADCILRNGQAVAEFERRYYIYRSYLDPKS